MTPALSGRWRPTQTAPATASSSAATPSPASTLLLSCRSSEEYVGKVRLAYLDPPFNTQQSFLHYDDALEHSVWLTMMRDRLLQGFEAARSQAWCCPSWESRWPSR